MLGVMLSISASGMKDIIGFRITRSKPLALLSTKNNLYMRSNWEECIISLTAQLEMVNERLEKRHKEIQKYLQNNTDSKDGALLLIAEQRAAKTSFQSLEDKIHDMIIYLCRAITLEKINNKEWDTTLFGNTIDS